MTTIPVVTVGVDGSESAFAAADWAATYAQSHGAQLRLVNGLEMPVPVYAPVPLGDLRDAVEADARKILGQVLDRIHAAVPGAEATASVVARPPVPALLDASKRSALLVVGCRGLNELAHVVLGSVSASVVAHAACPVAVVRGAGAARTDGPVVVGVHGDGDENATLGTAFDEATRRGVPLVAVHVWSDVTPVAAADAVVGVWPTWERLREEAGNRLRATLEPWRTKYPAVEVRTLITRDRPAHALLEQAATAQLVVVGTHGRGGFPGMRLGSVARRLVHHADCPVLVVRAAGTEGGE